jgi:hypothetical protein
VQERKLCQNSHGGGDYVFTANSEEELRENALQFLLKAYTADPWHDFSAGYIAEIVFAKSTITSDGDNIKDGYAVAIRKRDTNELMGIIQFGVKIKDGDIEYLSWEGTEPFYPAIKENGETFPIPGNSSTPPNPFPTHEELVEWEKSHSLFDVNAPFPPISEVRAREILDGYMNEIGISKESGEVKRIGYSILYAYNPPKDRYYSINGADKPFHEFIVDNERVWVNAWDGKVFDESQLEWIAQVNQKAAKYPALLPEQYERSKR